MRGLVVLCAFLLGEANLTAQSPAEILKEAINKSFQCPYIGHKTDLNSNGKPIKWGPFDQEDQRKADNLSLQIFFRPGRYNLGSKVLLGALPSTLTIDFNPWEKKLEPQPGESALLNTALNNLKGAVLIDEETHEVVRVHGEVHDLRYFLFMGKLDNLTVDLYQKYAKGKWTPDSFELEANGYTRKMIVAKTFSKRYHVDFECSSAE